MSNTKLQPKVQKKAKLQTETESFTLIITPFLDREGERDYEVSDRDHKLLSLPTTQNKLSKAIPLQKNEIEKLVKEIDERSNQSQVDIEEFKKTVRKLQNNESIPLLT